MTQPLLHDFNFDEAELSESPAPPLRELVETPGVPAPAIPTPVIVVEQRVHRSLVALLAPPALILLAALVITSYQRTQPVRYLAPRTVTTTPPTPPTVAPPDEKILVRAVNHDELAAPPLEKTAPKPETALVAAAEKTKTAQPDSDRSSFEFEPDETAPAPASQPEKKVVRVVPPFDLVPKEKTEADPKPEDKPEPPKAVVALVPEKPPVPPAEAQADFTKPLPEAPEPSKDDIMNDIARESREKAVVKEDMQGQKVNARLILFKESLDRIQSTRTAFREDLKRAMESLGPDAPAEIERLCIQYGREPMPEVKLAYRRLMRRAPPRMTFQNEIDYMRSAGYPEPAILDHLAGVLLKTMRTRGGPRDQNEVKLRAAQELLKHPIGKTIKLAPPTRFSDDSLTPRGIDARPIGRP